MENHEKFKNLKNKFKEHFSENLENSYAKKQITKKKKKVKKTKSIKKTNKKQVIKTSQKNCQYLSR